MLMRAQSGWPEVKGGRGRTWMVGEFLEESPRRHGQTLSQSAIQSPWRGFSLREIIRGIIRNGISKSVQKRI